MQRSTLSCPARPSRTFHSIKPICTPPVANKTTAFGYVAHLRAPTPSRNYWQLPRRWRLKADPISLVVRTLPSILSNHSGHAVSALADKMLKLCVSGESQRAGADFTPYPTMMSGPVRRSVHVSDTCSAVHRLASSTSVLARDAMLCDFLLTQRSSPMC